MTAVTCIVLLLRGENAYKFPFIKDIEQWTAQVSCV